MNNFFFYLESWHLFYTAMVGACAALMGLIFLAVSLRTELFTRKDVPEPRNIAWQTFLNFFCVFVIAITFLIPVTSPGALGLILAALGAAGTILVIRRWWRARTHINFKRALIAFLPLLVCYLAITGSGLSGAFHSFNDMNVIAPVTIFLIGVAIYNAWELLFSYQNRKG
jgi:hypothetical protein